MSHPWSVDARFWRRLLKLDRQVADKTQELGCQRCGGPLHVADYPRKPRGELGEWEEAFCRRLSFCCGHCRRRATPPSVRFLGRKVYVGQLVVAASLLWQDLCGRVERRVAGVPRRTVARWLRWWREALPASAFWGEASSFLMPPVASTDLPGALVMRFGTAGGAVAKTLAFLAPTTTCSASYVRVGIAHAEDGVW